MFVQDAGAWIVCRMIIGLSLATFVCSQVWCAQVRQDPPPARSPARTTLPSRRLPPHLLASRLPRSTLAVQMYNKSVVGIANATSAGWGNLGGGVTNLLMPYIFLGFYGAVSGSSAEKEDLSWRLCYIVPLAMHLCGGFFALTARDLPDGNIAELEKSGAKQKSKGSIVLKTGLSNVNAWILTATYGMCFGVELTMNSVAALYFHEYHGLTPQIAGLLASLYGLMNLVARSAGGMLSDYSNKKAGMRGRLWSAWIVQTLEGALCCCMAAVTLGADAPFDRGTTMGYVKLDDLPSGTFSSTHTHDGLTMDTLSNLPDGERDGWVPVNGTVVDECGCDQTALPDAIQKLWGIDDSLYMIFEPPWAREGAAGDCIQHQNLAGMGVLCMILFSICVQAAEGLHYGIVPYVSRPALGIVSGMVGAGGNLGSVIALSAFFRGKTTRTDEGFMNLGILVMVITAGLFFLYFPEMGGMLVPAGGLGKYDPQLIKPPADYRGADSMDFANVNKADSKDVEAVRVQQTNA
jgi:NNP family nitrate/nitrite transporter-like MFS transporter